MRFFIATVLLATTGCQSIGSPNLAMLDLAGKRQDAKVVEHMQKSRFPSPADVGLKDADALR